MNREQLVALRDAIDTVLTWPDDVRTQIAAWLAPEAAPKPGNGLDHHPAQVAPPTKGAAAPSSLAKAPANNTFNRKTIELQLLRALRDNPTGMTAGALARATGAPHTTTAVRLKDMGERGLIEKDAEGLWRLAGDEARQDGQNGQLAQVAHPPPVQPNPTLAPLA